MTFATLSQICSGVHVSLWTRVSSGACRLGIPCPYMVPLASKSEPRRVIRNSIALSIPPHMMRKAFVSIGAQIQESPATLRADEPYVRASQLVPTGRKVRRI